MRRLASSRAPWQSSPQPELRPPDRVGGGAPTIALPWVRRGALALLACAFALPARAQPVDSPAAAPAEVELAPPAAPAEVELAAKPSPEARRAQLLRRSNSYLGPVGGIHVIEAGSGAPETFRLQVFTDFFFKDDYLFDDDETRYAGGSLSLGITPIEHLEISAAVTARSLKNSVANPEVLQSIGDPYLDFKGYGEVAEGVTVGGDLLLSFLTAPSDQNIDYAGTSVGLRANLSLDLREMAPRLPLELRFNGGYYFDQSSKIIEPTERERLRERSAEQIAADPSGMNDYQHFARRNERLAFAINRVDHTALALGLEAPLALSRRVALHPLAEWELWIPANRQGYDCALVELASGQKAPGQDSCLADEGADTWTQRITVGARVFPMIAGLSFLAAIEVGVGGSTNFVRELAPNPPYRVMFAAAYTVDPVKLESKPIKEVERVEVPIAPTEGRVVGTVVEQGGALPIAGARVRFTDRALSTVLSDTQGRFISYMFPPGEVAMEVEADGYEPGGCRASIPSRGGEVPATCPLVALPRVGSLAVRVLGLNGAPVPGVQVAITGPSERTPSSDPDGRLREEALPPGDYQARIEHPGYLISITPIHIDARKETALDIQLVPKPAQPKVVVQKTKLVLRGKIFFDTNTAEIQPRSEPLLTEIADVLLRTPELEQIEVQGHTDTVGTPEYNRELSQRRADSVMDWLVRAGVGAERLLSKGYGSDKPVAPNTAEPGRAKNRRVEFMILQRAGKPVGPAQGAARGAPAGAGAAAGRTRTPDAAAVPAPATPGATPAPAPAPAPGPAP